MQINAETVPQLTYDIIGRVLPGLLFLSLIFFGATAIGKVCDIESGNEITKLMLFGYLDINIGLFNSILVLFYSYLLGWLFYQEKDGITKYKLEGKWPIKRKKRINALSVQLVSDLRLMIKTPINTDGESSIVNTTIGEEKKLRETLYKMYHYIRLADSRAGLRLVKLRAENRMWGAIMYSYTILLIGIAISMILSCLYLYETTGCSLCRWHINEFCIQNMCWLVFKCFTIIPLMIFIYKRYNEEQRFKLWKKYWQNIISHYYLMEDYPALFKQKKEQ